MKASLIVLLAASMLVGCVKKYDSPEAAQQAAEKKAEMRETHEMTAQMLSKSDDLEKWCIDGQVFLRYNGYREGSLTQVMVYNSFYSSSIPKIC